MGWFLLGGLVVFFGGIIWMVWPTMRARCPKCGKGIKYGPRTHCH